MSTDSTLVPVKYSMPATKIKNFVLLVYSVSVCPLPFFTPIPDVTQQVHEPQNITLFLVPIRSLLISSSTNAGMEAGQTRGA